MPMGRMHDDSGRFIETDQILVLIDDLDRFVRGNDLPRRIVRENDAECIPFPEPPVHEDRLPVDRDAVVRLVFRAGDVMGDELPLVQNDISYRTSLILRTGSPGKDPPRDSSLFRLVGLLIFPQNDSSLS